MKIQEYYQETSKNCDLPNFDIFNSIFDIDDIEHGNFSKKIAERMVDKFENYRKLLEEYLTADGSNLAVLNEIKGMNDKDKELIISCYTKCVLVDREFMILELSENDFSLFIKKSYETFEKIKGDIRKILEKAKDSWSITSEIKEKLGYLG